MGRRWTFEGDVEPGHVLVAYSRAGEELGRWPGPGSEPVEEAAVEADEEPEWRVETPPAIPGSPA